MSALGRPYETLKQDGRVETVQPFKNISLEMGFWEDKRIVWGSITSKGKKEKFLWEYPKQISHISLKISFCPAFSQSLLIYIRSKHKGKTGWDNSRSFDMLPCDEIVLSNLMFWGSFVLLHEGREAGMNRWGYWFQPSQKSSCSALLNLC